MGHFNSVESSFFFINIGFPCHKSHMTDKSTGPFPSTSGFVQSSSQIPVSQTLRKLSRAPSRTELRHAFAARRLSLEGSENQPSNLKSPRPGAQESSRSEPANGKTDFTSSGSQGSANEDGMDERQNRSLKIKIKIPPKFRKPVAASNTLPLLTESLKESNVGLLVDTSNLECECTPFIHL